MYTLSLEKVQNFYHIFKSSGLKKYFFFLKKAQTQVGLYLIIFIFGTITSLTAPSTQKQCLVHDKYSTTSYLIDPILFSGPFLVFSPRETQSEWWIFYSSVFKPRTCESSISIVPGPSLSHCCPSQPHATKEQTGPHPAFSSQKTTHLLVLAWKAHLLGKKCPAWQSSTPGPSAWARAPFSASAVK